MSLLVGYEMEEGFYGLCCSECSAFVGAITINEAQCLMRDGIVPFCFDCDPARVDCVPSHFILEQDTYMVGVGSEIFLAEWLSDDILWNPQDLKMHRISYTTFFDLKTGRGPQYT